ncbi:MAG: T9SS type A sorting domain-containing protein [Bacteroidales bacterium]|nr:T9SS type A sorting domain-containing protein [Bacteroidales bacterium]
MKNLFVLNMLICFVFFQNILPLTSQNNVKEYGDIFWEEDFDSLEWSTYDTIGEMPEGWELYDGNGLDYFWRWSLEGPRGRYTSPDASPAGGDASFVPHPGRMNYGGTAANGFMMLESDYFNTGEDGLILSNLTYMDSYFQLPVIDLSDAPGVILSFNQFCRVCCMGSSTISIFVCVDYNPEHPEEMHWAEFDSHEFFSPPICCYTFEEDRHREINISDIAAGQSEVVIRWHKKDFSHYFWIVDDIKLFEPAANDIVLDFSWFDYMYEPEGNDPKKDWNGGYTMIPAGQEGEFVSFRAAVANFGLADQTNVVLNAKIYKDDVLIETITSSPKNINVEQKDTLIINASWTPQGLGHYQVSTTVTMDIADQIPSNNEYEYEFQITNTTFSRSYDLNEYGSTSSTNDWVGGGAEGDALAILYDVPNDAEVTSISLHIASNKQNTEYIQAGDFGMVARLYTFDETTGEPTTSPIISSAYYTLQIDDTSSWVILDFLEDGVNQHINAGRYLATVEFYKGDGHPDDRFRVSEDISIPQPDYNMWIIQADGWGWVTGNACIRLNVVPPGTVIYNVTFNVDMNYVTNFTPGTDVIYITGSMVDWAEPGSNDDYIMFDTDEDGIYTITLTMESGVYEYKYFMNAGWNGGEWQGDPNRQFTVSADMILNDIGSWNKIDELNISNLSMYPNPVNDVLNISNIFNVDRIVVSNILGQKVKTFNNVSADIEINTSELEKGVYIITFIDKYNNTSAKRFIKE